jgi:hypothetical protein
MWESCSPDQPKEEAEMATWENAANTSMQEAVNNHYLSQAEAAQLRLDIGAWADTIGNRRDRRFNIPNTKKWAEVTVEYHCVQGVTINMG